MKILVIGNGAREHAIGYALNKSKKVSKLYFAPGNGGTVELGENIEIGANDIDKLLIFALENLIDITVVGPEEPLCLGIVDKFEEAGLKIFGPSKAAARLEGSKNFAKEFMIRHNIPTAQYCRVNSLSDAIAKAKNIRNKSPFLKVVLKADGLCQGKGVIIAESDRQIEEFCKAVLEERVFGVCDLLVEEFLEGFEVSFLCFVDNNTIVPMPTVRDHKKAYDGEKGPNTGGMGTYSPNSQADIYHDEIIKLVAEPFLKGIKKDKLDFRGVIFFGIMITEHGIKVLEFNTRFGDPETQSIILRMESDIFQVFDKIIQGKLEEAELRFNNQKVISVVLASKGYPKAYEKGLKITGVEDSKVVVFHGGTERKFDELLTSGGRVMTVCYAQDTFESAYDNVYRAIDNIKFEGKEYRRDISPLVNRIYVKKKSNFDVESRSLMEELKEKLKIDLKSVKIYQRYDIENISKKEILKISDLILSESPVDDIYMFEDAFELQKTMQNPLVIQYHQGQFDQRKQGLIDGITVALEREDIIAKYARVIEFTGDLNTEDMKKIEAYLINPVDQEKGKFLEVPTTLKEEYVVNVQENFYEGFISWNKHQLSDFICKKGLALNIEDLKIIQEYFILENREPSETEIAMIDTYWSDHCRHTTFNTDIVSVSFHKTSNELDKTIKKTFEDYKMSRNQLKRTENMSLMDLATIVQRKMRSEGLLDDLEISSEINACSIKIKARIDDRVEDYLLMFKNETHNHPTEIEPFGGASTCLGGAIRDPLSGRSYVYQAMRITGSADPREPLEDTLDGKLPQRQITLQAAKGYSSYGNQIGIATGLVDEVYHPNFKAKRMEVGAVIGAVPMENVRREEAVCGDVVLLIGGRTGRDGVGGATGSSKEHTQESIIISSAEVQKGNAPMERRLQRLFRNPVVSKLIKKCNDFGAGGISVAIGELADSLEIRLESVPLKYRDLTPREIAISESQERMAVVIEKKDMDTFFDFCHSENLEVTYVADVTDTNRLVMRYKDLTIVDISRDFLNSNGAKRKQEVIIEKSQKIEFFDKNKKFTSIENKLMATMKDLNIGSKKWLIERFDSSIGRNTVLQPLGGKNQITPIQSMVATIPSISGIGYTASLMSYGYNPYLSLESPFLGGYYAVIESLCKIAASGANSLSARLSFQEYFEKLGNDPHKWSKPLEALLGAYKATSELNVPPIGGKDSMSGTFKDMNVPPTLISFAVATEDVETIISPELKGGKKLGLILTKTLDDMTLDIEEFKANLKILRREILNKNIVSAYGINHKGLLPMVMEMSFGNDCNFDINIDNDLLFTPRYGNFIVEYTEDVEGIRKIGSSNYDGETLVNGIKLDAPSLKSTYLNVLTEIFSQEKIKSTILPKGTIVNKIFKSKNPVKVPQALIAVFPGSNCEYDSQKAFEIAGAKVETFVFNNLTVKDIKLSIDKFAKKIKESQILFIPGGFSLSDEPDGSGKFIAAVLMNKKIKKAIEYLLEETDGLIIGICNGFQALIKTGLLPYGKIQKVKDTDPTLTYNEIGRHIARMVDTKLVSNNSPWLLKLNTDEIYKIPISHGEGRFVCDEKTFKMLEENNQIAFMYMDNPNGSDYSIEGIVSPCGRILGKMGHSERLDQLLYKNIPDKIEQNIFLAGVEYFKK
ncbi:MAG: phosphoribosylformylglycinamidine synthase [Filifactoraceae bacterium]